MLAFPRGWRGLQSDPQEASSFTLPTPIGNFNALIYRDQTRVKVPLISVKRGVFQKQSRFKKTCINGTLFIKLPRCTLSTLSVDRWVAIKLL